MGQAKRRKQVMEGLTGLQDAVEKISPALIKIFSAASGAFGGDCFDHAEFGRELLADFGFHGRTVCGHSAWRLGDGDGDVLSHTTKEVGYLPDGAEGFAFHAWIEVADYIIDFTTYQIPEKIRQLDAADGGKTQVDWAPDFLLLERKQLRKYEDVANLHAGIAYYEEVPGYYERLNSTHEIDVDYLENARFLIKNPSVQVVGPRQVDALGRDAP